eukprot:TRINITY_DN3469_c0_g4_i1.p1 TRINITY_DN3469_c0_g4~~TRINITY_DN3469_c0_g4_i1.p1  ORF type:complete len:140 (-),score=6.39 TRINITY_DN3469_c0_g4_i1:123-542(-)
MKSFNGLRMCSTSLGRLLLRLRNAWLSSKNEMTGTTLLSTTAKEPLVLGFPFDPAKVLLSAVSSLIQNSSVPVLKLLEEEDGVQTFNIVKSVINIVASPATQNIFFLYSSLKKGFDNALSETNDSFRCLALQRLTKLGQ